MKSEIDFPPIAQPGKSMPALKNTRHEAFAQAVANGSTGVQAYRAHVAQEGSKTNACMTGASILLDDPNVAQRVQELKKKCEQMAEKRFDFTKQKLVGYLLEVLETPAGELDENHRLANEVTRDEIMGGDAGDTATITRVKIKGISKAEAAKQLAALCGWNEAEKHEHSGSVKITIGGEA